MGLFSKLSSSSSSNKSSASHTHYAPPPGAPPPQQASSGGAQPHHHQQQAYPQPPQQHQQYQQQQQQQQQPAQQHTYAAPSQPPPQQYYQPPAAASGREDPLQGQRSALQQQSTVETSLAPGQDEPYLTHTPSSVPTTPALKKYDTVFLVDDSGSMEMFWEDQLAPALAAVIQTAIRYDDDGVDIYFFNSRHHATSRSAPELLQLFQKVWPSKSTPTASALRRVLDPYVSNLENWVVEGKPSGYPRPKPMNLIVLTDGAPDRGEAAEPVIVEIAQRLDKMRMPPFQLGIQFVQIGTDDEAAQSLRSLDDDLREKHGIRDIVDTTLFDVQGGQLNVEYLMKALLGGMNRSIDNQ
ncbi:BQ5605_C019g08924 [Microbotryum silenes-dioicae]|uniref:BQ5605_C019g08924 protein n=1 Tax=Microbotryum silenes-dioicae TaxID=796604 RepID=A0A2X0M0S6_9BASI|nr:BQ5605_C019g08924 [Microbotryum silenes-dioicae]